jgi:hypothetical protein
MKANPDQMSLDFGLATGELGKAQGIARVATSNDEWMGWAGPVFHCFLACTPGPFIMADFRDFIAREQSLSDPISHNAWGALTSAFASQGFIRSTGNYRKSHLPQAHARRLTEWIRA